MSEDADALRARVAELEARVARHPATADERDLVIGVKAIADALHACADSVMRWTHPGYPRRLLAWIDHAGALVTTRAIIEQWRYEGLVPYAVHVRQREALREARGQGPSERARTKQHARRKAS